MINWSLIIDAIPYLARGALVSLYISAIGYIIGIGFGTLLGLLQTSSHALVRGSITFYVTIVRGTPMLIQIAFAVYALPEVGIKIPPFWAASIAIGCNSAAYVSQIVRSGITSIHKGQIEAGRVLGFTYMQIIWYIILPQAFAAILPALSNECITLIKDSSLASTVGVAELTRAGSLIRSRTFDALSVYVVLALAYLIMTTAVSCILGYIEKRLKRHA